MHYLKQSCSETHKGNNHFVMLIISLQFISFVSSDVGALGVLKSEVTLVQARVMAVCLLFLTSHLNGCMSLFSQGPQYACHLV